MKRALILLSLLSQSFIVIGQSDINTFSMDALVRGKSAIILDEKLEINIYGKRRDVTEGGVSTYQAFRIFRDVTIKIIKPEGLQIFRKFKLPESFNPINRYHASAVKNLGDYYSGYKIDDFKVNVIRSGVKPFSPKVKKRIKSVESFNINFLYDYSQHIYSIEGLEVGDEVRMRYELTIPFQENYSRFASYRIFHHDSIPKLKYRLTITNHESLDFELYQKNGSKSKRHFTENKIEKRMWEYVNLSGCINESGSKPYLELPHITWVINSYKYYVHNKGGYENIPHYAVIAQLRTPNLFDIFRSIEIGSQSKQFAPFTRTYNKMAESKLESHLLIRQIHNTINDEFKYENDLQFYRRNDMRGERLGEFFENGIVRDASRYNMTFAYLAKSKVEFFSAYLIDNRSGVISDEYFQPTFDNDCLLSVYFGEHLFDFILPKRHSQGWYYNEIPFYYEDTKARLVHISDYSTYKTPVKKDFRSLTTGMNKGSDNTRQLTIRAMVDLDNDSVLYSGNVTLSGQYSTMCRGAYMGGYKDPSVDSRYTKAIWDIVPNSSRGQNISQSVQPEYPFKAEFDFSFGSKNNVENKGHHYEVNIAYLMPHVFPRISDTEARFLSFYSDFMGNDIIEYEFQFVKPVELIEPMEYFVQNDYGLYKFSVSQKSALTLTVTSEFQVHSIEVGVQDVEEITAVTDAIRKFKNFKVKVK